MNQTVLPSGHTRVNHVEMRGITKRFPGVLANADVNFDVRAGEIHALLGENGAGKSTLMKALYGLYQPDAGEILLDGKPVMLDSPAIALQHGIGMIHQHFMLVQTLTVTENIALGMEAAYTKVDLVGVRRQLIELSEIYGLKIDPDAYIWQLSVGEQQRVEIVKALYRGGAIVILDEPTAVLTPQEVSELFVTLKRMREQGHALIFISHKLHEVQDLSDRITVMRDGRVVDTIPNDGVDRPTLARMMVGREVQLQPDRPDTEVGEARLVVRDLCALNDRGLPALDNVSFDVYSGEIVGIAGVSGNGQRELAEVIYGLRAATSGEILLDNQPIHDLSVSARLARGLAFIPEERMKHGIIGNFSVGENAILQEHANLPFANRSLFNFTAIARHTAELITRFNIKTPSQDTSIKNLSGGNIQKLILGRELSRQPRILIAAQPTRGVDISATEQIRHILMEERSNNAAILLISEDLDEILALSDRIIVFFEGRIMQKLSREEANVESLGLLMAGVTQ